MSLLTNNLTPAISKKWLIPALVIVLVIGATIGFFVYRHHVIQKKLTYEATLPAVRISLKNGCGFEGAATDMTEFLSDKNIDIVSTGNAEKFIYNKTIIVVKEWDPKDLVRLMKMTGITQWTRAESDFPVAPFVIIIGKDYEDLIANQKKAKE
jgi:hypothetical protein